MDQGDLDIEGVSTLTEKFPDNKGYENKLRSYQLKDDQLSPVDWTRTSILYFRGKCSSHCICRVEPVVRVELTSFFLTKEAPSHEG